MSILRTHDYFLSEDALEREIMRPHPHLGLLYIASHLEAQGVDFEAYDSTFRELSELLEQAIRWMTHEVAGERSRRRGLGGWPGRLRSHLGSLQGRLGTWWHLDGRVA